MNKNKQTNEEQKYETIVDLLLDNSNILLSIVFQDILSASPCVSASENILAVILLNIQL